MRTRLATLASAFLAAACQRCGTEPAGIEVAPLPEPPRIEAAEEALPGAGGELAVVVARPQGPAEGNFRPTSS
jgi:hypothetical protein